MAEKKYQVFVSSTFADLIEERRKILDILLMANCIPAGMEAFPASDNEQYEVIKKVIDLCDYYVLIIGKRYGSVNPSTGLSYTEMEYEYAKEIGVPVLVFAIDTFIELSEDKLEQDVDNARKLEAFREKALKNRLAVIWKSSEDLTGKLAVSIMRAENEIIRPGWQRAVDYDEASLRRDLMDSREQIKALTTELKNAKDTIDSFNTQADVAFDDYEINIEYKDFTGRYAADRQISITLTQLFSVISIEMMDVMITEEAIARAIIQQVLHGPITYTSIKDSQLVKRMLNQYKALGLITSNWNEDKSQLFWGLTAKGVKMRDDLTLMRNDTPN